MPPAASSWRIVQIPLPPASTASSYPTQCSNPLRQILYQDNCSWLLQSFPRVHLPVVRYDAKASERSLDLLRWGLVPYWAKDIKVGFANINAKAEGIESKPAFRDAFQRRSCLLPVDNFYDGRKPLTASSLMRLRSPIRASWLWPACGRTGAHRRESGCAASRSSRPRRTSYARNCTIGCRWSWARDLASSARGGTGGPAATQVASR